MPYANPNSKDVFVNLLLTEIKSVSFSDIADKKLRKSILSEKTVLIEVLHRFAPSAFEDLAAEVDATNNQWLRYLIKNAANHS